MAVQRRCDCGLEDGVKSPSWMRWRAEKGWRRGREDLNSSSYAVATYYLITGEAVLIFRDSTDQVRQTQAADYDGLVSRNRDLGFGRESNGGYCLEPSPSAPLITTLLP